MKFIVRSGLFILIVLVTTSVSAVAQQRDPRQILASVIQQLQTGTPNPQWYGVQLWFTIAQQTGNTGRYGQLARLGPATNITLTQTTRLPAGRLYALIAQHQRGMSVWVLGISDVTNRIEYANFQAGAAQQPLPDPQPPTGSGDSPPESGSPGPSSPGTSEACRKYPSLC
jgi:hypothetical protein